MLFIESLLFAFLRFLFLLKYLPVQPAAQHSSVKDTSTHPQAQVCVSNQLQSIVSWSSTVDMPLARLGKVSRHSGRFSLLPIPCWLFRPGILQGQMLHVFTKIVQPISAFVVLLRSFKFVVLHPLLSV